MGRWIGDFDGEVALVTGAASGIGRAVVRALAVAGTRVHGFDLRIPRASELDLAPDGREPAFHTVDVRRTAEVERAVAEVLDAEGHLDHLVNGAGLLRDRALWNLTDEEWEEVLDVNLSGAWRLLRAVAPAMRERRRGRIVQIASINALRGKFGQANYSASKAGLIALTRTAARELGPRGITVNAVAPGMIETPMSAELPEEVRARALEETATGRLGLPRDVAAAVMFLLSDGAAHVTGAVLRVDGGQSS